MSKIDDFRRKTDALFSASGGAAPARPLVEFNGASLVRDEANTCFIGFHPDYPDSVVIYPQSASGQPAMENACDAEFLRAGQPELLDKAFPGHRFRSYSVLDDEAPTLEATGATQTGRECRFLAVLSDMSIGTGVPLDVVSRIVRALAAHGMRSMAELNGFDVFILDRSLKGSVNEANSRSIALPKLNTFVVGHGTDLRVTDAAGKEWRIDEGVSGYGAEAVAGEVARPRARM